MKFYITKIFYFLIISIFLQSFSIESLLAWGGYDYDKKTEIDIGQGNLVREGNVIQYYDAVDDNFRTAKVLTMQDGVGGVELGILDLDSKKERNFVMYR